MVYSIMLARCHFYMSTCKGSRILAKIHFISAGITPYAVKRAITYFTRLGVAVAGPVVFPVVVRKHLAVAGQCAPYDLRNEVAMFSNWCNAGPLC